MKIRKDNDFVFNWAINWNGIAEDFTGATNMVLTASVFGSVKTIPDECYSIIGNIVRIEFTPEICNIPGVYRLELKYSKPSFEFVDGERRSAVDVKAFKIVETSDNADTTHNLSSTSDAVAGFALKYEDLTAEQKEELRGKGITSIELSTQDGDTKTYTITYADGETFDFDVADGHSPVFTFSGTVLLIDGVPQVDLKGETGNGIASVTLTSTAGLVKTYTITFTDATTATFTVTDGAAAVVQEKGSNTSVVMSQKAVTDELVQLAGDVNQKIGLNGRYDLFKTEEAHLFQDLLSVRRYTSNTLFNDYAVGYNQISTNNGVRVSIPSSGSSGITHYLRTGIVGKIGTKYVNEIIFESEIIAIGLGFGYIDGNGNFVQYTYTKSGYLRRYQNYSQTYASAIIQPLVVGDILRWEVYDETLTLYINDIEVAKIDVIGEYIGELLIAQRGFGVYVSKITEILDPIVDYVKKEIFTVEEKIAQSAKQADLIQLAETVEEKVNSSMIPDIFATNDSPIESYTVTRSFTGGSFNNYETGQYQTINANDVTINIPVAGAASVLHHLPTGRSIENGKTYTVVYAQLSSLGGLMPSITAVKEGIYTTIGYTASGVPRKIVRQSGVPGTQTDLSGVIRAIATGDEVKITYRDGVTSIFLNGENIWNHTESLDGEFAISIGGFGSTNYTYSIVADYVRDFVKAEIGKIEKVYPKSFFQYSHANQTFYVFSHISDDRYGRASIVRETNVDAYLDYWRLKQIDGYTYNADTGEFMNDGTLLLSVGENECVWRRSALSDDFTGGFHGDEKYQRLQILVDGVALELPTADIALTKCNSFRYIVHSEMYKTAQGGVTDHAIECYHVKVTDIENGGYKTFNRLTWAVGGSLSLWYAGISCVGKVCATQVATDADFVPVLYTGAQGAVPEFTGFREMHAYNPTSKYSAKVTSRIIKPAAQDATAVMFINDRGVDSKYYRRLSGYNPTVGEVWESDMTVSYGVIG